MLTVVIPYYCTKEEFFKKCINSLTSDTNTDAEILVIDDGSPKEFQKVLSAICDDRVRIIHLPHGGVSKARNAGIGEAQGEWLTFIDADDFVEPGFISTLQKMTDLKADLIFYNGFAEKQGRTYKNNFILKEGLDYASKKQLKLDVMESALSLGRVPIPRKCMFSLGSPCCKLIKTKFLQKKNIKFDPSIRFAEDTLFSLNLIKEVDSIFYYDKYLYHYNINEESATGKYRQNLSNDTDEFFKAVWNFIVDNGYEVELKEAYDIRAFLEVQRSIRQEFYHKNNPDAVSVKFRKAMRFINTEPYKDALMSKYTYMRSLPCQVASTLLRAGMFDLYMSMYSVLGDAKKLLHRM